ncbi:NAD-dependent epimerase/dehydratase family protein [Alysiella filiformis]|uniref:Uncharacterized conserved protein YbjT, contains NAD(P)-binding and DUF2867 domains n=1 Tax=Alysiella filiformis DSM 16848 TaxID=1120981 RepID=A0A286E1Q6_9NEIS|nr:NAD-dependent epimerase/dehydratase family protein [Alysiella filiformis]QMT30777.1 NAD-dependent epimerase/dehydratase family protein [Alysiella filiformis]UBQ56242.1 NAD-dependent epimerase/dehydratase family protein [Alysiella filiformis DSM 16848]SOD64820.1 Uncharacterized conserved protein YbjT, contains NAD(P)-binding and DUF2867 domains [Alysiella filiformis DSM 16848]
MNILIFGGRGFIGKQIARILRERGHQVHIATRQEVDFVNLNETSAKKVLQNQDVIVNAVGVMSRHADVLETVHHHTPVKLAAWAREVGVKHWVQLSALGADAAHEVPFVGSKGRGDVALLSSGLTVNVGRPSIVFGRGGESCEAFLKMANMPIWALPNGGQFDFQPVHVFDVAEGLANMAEHPLPHGTIVNMTGATQHTLADYLQILRQVVHGKPNHLKIIPIPMALIAPTLPMMNVLSNGFVSAGSMKLLQQGSCADCGDFAALLGREPLGVRDFVY